MAARLTRAPFALALAAAAATGCAVVEERPHAPAMPDCVRQGDGQRVCGYACVVGRDGVAACGDLPDDVCAVGPDGRAACTHRTAEEAVPPPPPRRECKPGPGDAPVCGYNCREGQAEHAGTWYCAGEPEGECLLNPDGSWTCP